jgi:multidrug efflux pump subunit AcrA (membrane-fusion protein)
MGHSLPSLPRACCLLAVLGALSGFARKPAATTDTSPPVVSVSKPVERPVKDYVDFTGRTEAPDSVDVRARVTGYLTRMPFKEGEEVKKGQLLFEFDDRPYKADLDRAKGDLERTKGNSATSSSRPSRAARTAKKPSWFGCATSPGSSWAPRTTTRRAAWTGAPPWAWPFISSPAPTRWTSPAACGRRWSS